MRITNKLHEQASRHKRVQLTNAGITTKKRMKQVESSRPSHFLFKLSFIIQIWSLPACLLSCSSASLLGADQLHSSPIPTATVTAAAAAASSKRKEVKQSSPSNSHSIKFILSPRVAPSLSQCSNFSKPKYHIIFFFGPLFSKAETEYHDSQRKKRKGGIAQSSYHAHE